MVARALFAWMLRTRAPMVPEYGEMNAMSLLTIQLPNDDFDPISIHSLLTFKLLTPFVRASKRRPNNDPNKAISDNTIDSMYKFEHEKQSAGNDEF